MFTFRFGLKYVGGLTVSSNPTEIYAVPFFSKAMTSYFSVPGENVGLATFEALDNDRYIADGTVRLPPARRIQLRGPSAFAAPVGWFA